MSDFNDITKSLNDNRKAGNDNNRYSNDNNMQKVAANNNQLISSFSKDIGNHFSRLNQKVSELTQEMKKSKSGKIDKTENIFLAMVDAQKKMTNEVSKGNTLLRNFISVNTKLMSKLEKISSKNKDKKGSTEKQKRDTSLIHLKGINDTQKKMSIQLGNINETLKKLGSFSGNNSGTYTPRQYNRRNQGKNQLVPFAEAIVNGNNVNTKLDKTLVLINDNLKDLKESSYSNNNGSSLSVQNGNGGVKVPANNNSFLNNKLIAANDNVKQSFIDKLLSGAPLPGPLAWVLTTAAVVGAVIAAPIVVASESRGNFANTADSVKRTNNMHNRATSADFDADHNPDDYEKVKDKVQKETDERHHPTSPHIDKILPVIQPDLGTPMPNNPDTRISKPIPIKKPSITQSPNVSSSGIISTNSIPQPIEQIENINKDLKKEHIDSSKMTVGELTVGKLNIKDFNIISNSSSSSKSNITNNNDLSSTQSETPKDSITNSSTPNNNDSGSATPNDSFSRPSASNNQSSPSKKQSVTQTPIKDEDIDGVPVIRDGKLIESALENPKVKAAQQSAKEKGIADPVEAIQNKIKKHNETSSPSVSKKGGRVSTADTSLDTQQKALLDTIATGEAKDYNVAVGGGTFSDFSKHPHMGVGNSHADGRYQFEPGTWNGTVKEYNKENPTNPITDFTPKSQDRAALFLAQKDYKRRTGRNLNDDIHSDDPQIKSQIGSFLQTGLGGQGDNTTWQSLQQHYRSSTNIQKDFEKNIEKYNNPTKEDQPSSATNGSSAINATKDGIIKKGGASGDEKHVDELQPDVKNRLMALGIAYKDSSGKALPITSANRSYDEQLKQWNKRASNRYPVAAPGHSKHEGGKAFDIPKNIADMLDSNGTLESLGLYRPIRNDPVHIEVKPGAKQLSPEILSKLKGYEDKQKEIVTDATPQQKFGAGSGNPFTVAQKPTVAGKEDTPTSPYKLASATPSSKPSVITNDNSRLSSDTPGPRQNIMNNVITNDNVPFTPVSPKQNNEISPVQVAAPKPIPKADVPAPSTPKNEVEHNKMAKNTPTHVVNHNTTNHNEGKKPVHDTGTTPSSTFSASLDKFLYSHKIDAVA